MKYHKELMLQIAKLYKDFVEKGEFYNYSTTNEFGNRIYKANEIKEPYETVEDWLESLTGKTGANFVPETFNDVVNEIIEEFLVNEAKEEHNTNDLDDEIIMELDEERSDLIGDIGNLPISELQKYYQ